MSRLAILAIEAIIDFIITAGAVLTGYMTANGAVVMPSKGAIILTVIGGLVGAANQVRGRLKDLPVVGLLLAIGIAGCATFDPSKMSAEQLTAFAKIKDASVFCVIANTPYGKATSTYVNIDKGVILSGTLTVDDACKVTMTTAPTKP